MKPIFTSQVHPKHTLDWFLGLFFLSLSISLFLCKHTRLVFGCEMFLILDLVVVTHRFVSVCTDCARTLLAVRNVEINVQVCFVW